MKEFLKDPDFWKIFALLFGSAWILNQWIFMLKLSNLRYIYEALIGIRQSLTSISLALEDKDIELKIVKEEVKDVKVTETSLESPSKRESILKRKLAEARLRNDYTIW